MVQSSKPEAIAAEALLTAADTIERLAENCENVNEPLGPQRTWRRAFNAAYDYNTESDATGDAFDRVETLFSEVMIDSLESERAGCEAAEYYREQAREMLQ